MTTFRRLASLPQLLIALAVLPWLPRSLRDQHIRADLNGKGTRIGQGLRRQGVRSLRPYRRESLRLFLRDAETAHTPQVCLQERKIAETPSLRANSMRSGLPPRD